MEVGSGMADGRFISVVLGTGFVVGKEGNDWKKSGLTGHTGLSGEFCQNHVLASPPGRG